jgi:hypothetical protein
MAPSFRSKGRYLNGFSWRFKDYLLTDPSYNAYAADGEPDETTSFRPCRWEKRRTYSMRNVVGCGFMNTIRSKGDKVPVPYGSYDFTIGFRVARRGP